VRIVATSRRKLSNLINMALNEQPVHTAFLTDLQHAVVRHSTETARKPSKFYKPSAFVCMRQMYFTRTEQELDPSRSDYMGIGMADTGSRRHEAIQEVLLKMKDMGMDWEYMDVSDYVSMKQAEGNCLSLKVVGSRGAETKLFDKNLCVSFMCDGIIKRISTGEYFLFEFKNQISFKYANKRGVDDEHIIQVACYCALLDLSYAFVVYENRDVCELACPQLLHITAAMKQEVADKILLCETYVSKLIPPPAYDGTKPCRWCDYQSSCRKAGQT